MARKAKQAQGDKANPKNRLIEALKKLHQLFSSKSGWVPSCFPSTTVPATEGLSPTEAKAIFEQAKARTEQAKKEYPKKYPEAYAIKQTIFHARKILYKTPPEGGMVLDESIAPRSRLRQIDSFLCEADRFSGDLPADDAMLQKLNGQIMAISGKVPKRPAIAMREEDTLILETLADAYPAAVNQPDLERLTGIRRQILSDRLRWLNSKKLVKRPEGTQRKGHAITAAGLFAIGRLVDGPH